MYPEGESREKRHKDEEIVASEDNELKRVGIHPSYREQICGLSEIIESLYKHIHIPGFAEKKDEKDVDTDSPYNVVQCPVEEIIGVFTKNIPERIVFAQNHLDGIVAHGKDQEEKDKPFDAKKIDSLEPHMQ